MQREFDHIRDATQSIPWCARVWWADDDTELTIDTWFLVDSWYRSRALSFGIDKDALVPCVDMINHSQGEHTNAYFDKDQDGNAVLLLSKGQAFQQGDEITIRCVSLPMCRGSFADDHVDSYGDGKSASEMLFSYGFIETREGGTSGLSLDLAIPDDDPLKTAKEAVTDEAAAVRISLDNGSVKWESSAVWLSCVNEEDGLRFQVLQTNSGDRELRMLWRDKDITKDGANLVRLLQVDELWDVFQLRALAMVQGRVESQLAPLLLGVEEAMQPGQDTDGIRSRVWNAAATLRHLELELLEQAYRDFEAQVRGSLPLVIDSVVDDGIAFV